MRPLEAVDLFEHRHVGALRALNGRTISRRRLTILLSEIEQRIAFAVTMTIGTDHLRVGWDLPGAHEARDLTDELLGLLLGKTFETFTKAPKPGTLEAIEANEWGSLGHDIKKPQAHTESGRTDEAPFYRHARQCASAVQAALHRGGQGYRRRSPGLHQTADSGAREVMSGDETEPDRHFDTQGRVDQEHLGP